MLQRSAVTDAFLDATASTAADRAAIVSFLADGDFKPEYEYVLSLENDCNRLRKQLTASKHLEVHQGTQLLDPETKAIVGTVVAVDSTAGQTLALSLVSSVDWIVLTAWDPEICLQMIAACEKSPTQIALFVDSKRLSWMPTILFSLQPQAVVLLPDMKSWKSYSELRYAAKHKQLYLRDFTPSTTGTDINRGQCVGSMSPPALIEGTVVDVRSGGIADRVCLDLISLLHDGEGLLIGSEPNLLALVHAETFATEFVPARPFRVNAGSLHGCVLMADGSTKYLCEVTAGDQVAVVSASLGGAVGETKDRVGGAPWRAVAVGRCKTESRPMLLIEYETTSPSSSSSSQQRGTVFLQQAETVRLVSPSSSELLSEVPSELPSAVSLTGSPSETAPVVADPAVSAGTPTNHLPISQRWKALSVTQAAIGDSIFLSAAPTTN
jgi:hypothetical protein